MFSDTLFRIVNIAGGLGLDDELWRSQVLGVSPARAQSGAIRRRIEAALARGEAASALLEADRTVRPLCRTAG